MEEESLNSFDISDENFSMVFTETGGFSDGFMEKLLDINQDESEKNDEFEVKEKVPTKKRRNELIPRMEYRKVENDDKKMLKLTKITTRKKKLRCLMRRILRRLWK